jgi:hypothetical protein
MVNTNGVERDLGYYFTQVFVTVFVLNEQVCFIVGIFDKGDPCTNNGFYAVGLSVFYEFMEAKKRDVDYATAI